MKEKIFVLDDEENMVEIIKTALEEEGYEVRGFTSPEEFLYIFRNEDCDLLITDIRMMGMDGIEVLRRVKEIEPDLAVILITAYPSFETAVEALRGGAVDYIPKPIELKELKWRVKNAIENRRIRKEVRELKKFYFEDVALVGESPAILNIKEIIRKIAPVDSSVLITGESGVGKELVARAIHLLSGRKGNFVPLNCGAIPENLLESELFGYKKGAFTGATRNKDGLVVSADKGTLFLDEITELPSHLQVKLLRFLQDMEFIPLGDTKSRRVNVRVIAASNKDVEMEVDEGRLRKDLYYRLNVIRIHIPPLRERREDIPLLVEYIIGRLSSRLGMERKKVLDSTMEHLLSYPWPGNVRELENVLERAMILSEGSVIKPSHLPPYVREGSGIKMDGTLEDMERRLIEKVLEEVGGNIPKAARRLGIHPSTLYRKLKKMGRKK